MTMKSSLLTTSAAMATLAISSLSGMTDAFTPTPTQSLNRIVGIVTPVTLSETRQPSKSVKSISMSDMGRMSGTDRMSGLSGLLATLTAEEMETMTEDQLYETLGVEKDRLAMGIDADEVLEYIGTRQDLITKFQSDIPTFTPTQAEAEVDKFLMDGEMLDLYIKWSARKREDPNWEPAYAEGAGEVDNSPFAVASRIFGTYAIWIVAALIVNDLYKEYVDKNGAFGFLNKGGEEVLVSSVSSVWETVDQFSNVFSG